MIVFHHTQVFLVIGQVEILAFAEGSATEADSFFELFF
jgi:hypothetical protein